MPTIVYVLFGLMVLGFIYVVITGISLTHNNTKVYVGEYWAKKSGDKNASPFDIHPKDVVKVLEKCNNFNDEEYILYKFISTEVKESRTTTSFINDFYVLNSNRTPLSIDNEILKH